jgi:hypothetical protein
MQKADLKYTEQCAVACIAISNRNLDLLCKGPLDVQPLPDIPKTAVQPHHDKCTAQADIRGRWAAI